MDVYVLTKTEHSGCALCMAHETKIIGLYATVAEARLAARRVMGGDPDVVGEMPLDEASLRTWFELSDSTSERLESFPSWAKTDVLYGDEISVADWIDISHFRIAVPGNCDARS